MCCDAFERLSQKEEHHSGFTGILTEAPATLTLSGHEHPWGQGACVCCGQSSAHLRSIYTPASGQVARLPVCVQTLVAIDRKSATLRMIRYTQEYIYVK